MMNDTDAVYCELCRLPHRPGTVRCDECGHQIGTRPDWRTLEGQVPELRMKIALGLLAIAAMIGINRMLFGGAGYVVVFAPIIWTVQSLYRHSILTKRLAARERGDP